jgi:hypothetical protein
VVCANAAPAPTTPSTNAAADIRIILKILACEILIKSRTSRVEQLFHTLSGRDKDFPAMLLVSL